MKPVSCYEVADGMKLKCKAVRGYADAECDQKSEGKVCVLGEREVVGVGVAQRGGERSGRGRGG